MRVLHITAYFAPAFSYGGLPRSALGLSRALRQAGVEVEVFTTTANAGGELPASPPEGDLYDGVPVRYFPLSFPRGRFRARALERALESRADHDDIVHTHGLWNAPAWAAARHARRRRIPYVLSPHGMLDSGAMAHRALRKRIAYWLRERGHVRGAALLHATSSEEARSLERWAPGIPVAVVPNGVEVRGEASSTRDAFRRTLGLPPDTPLIVFLGRLHPIKRLDLLAAAFDRIRAARPGTHLIVAGPDEGGHRARLEPLFAGAGRAVRFVGELDETAKWALLANADVLAMCSQSESFGRSVLEALAAGVPVVVTRTCPWQQVETAGCGFWVAHTAEAIADATLELLRDPARARAMGERGQTLARSAYSWDAIARAMLLHYEAVARARPRPVTVA